METPGVCFQISRLHNIELGRRKYSPAIHQPCYRFSKWILSCNLEPEQNMRKQFRCQRRSKDQQVKTLTPPVASRRCAIHRLQVHLKLCLLPFIESRHLKGQKGQGNSVHLFVWMSKRAWETLVYSVFYSGINCGTLASREPKTRRPQWDLNLVSPGQPSTSLNWTAPEPNSAPGNRAAEEQAARHSN